ncbi:2-amino-4-hydroxy-6-hydroxymethyldihydropteridine diphosphokinase [Haliangium sp.]|uniref:2-amino-4-hydroxy-6- hydroxymethyldihydropteridine diphosphokinase n=1 Tax=Haliangium sp. TaxID=2663208 RepID=UPI003D10A1C7
MSDADQRPAFVALGGNLGGERAVFARLCAATAGLRERLHACAIRASPVYRSAPVGPVQEQPRFLNAVIVCSVPSALSPRDILVQLLALEASLGRRRDQSPAQGPRTIDLDLLFVAEERAASPGPPRLSLPHPRIAERAFVLQPLADLQGLDWVMPGIGRSVGDCLGRPEVAAQRATLEPYPERLVTRVAADPVNARVEP